MSENERSDPHLVDSQSFDRVADSYEVYRPGYPTELVDTILQYASLRPGDHILEIGSGTGQATRLFSRRGYAITCLEPGPNLAKAAAKKLADDPEVRFIQARFEDWEPGAERFDLLISAQAFHWVPEELRWPKSAQVLKPGGTLAPFWNMAPDPSPELRQEIQAAYQACAPELSRSRIPIREVIENRARSLRDSSFFEDVDVREFPWSARYDARSYLGLLSTFSDHLRLPEERRRQLFDRIGEVIERHGGAIDKPYLSVVYLARRCPG